MSHSAFPVLLRAAPDARLLYEGHYDPLLVVLSVAAAILAAYVMILAVRRARSEPEAMLRRLQVATGGLVMGAGAWVVHFVGMLAFTLPSSVTYDPWITIVAMVPAVLASTISVALLARPEPGMVKLLGAGVLLGAGIGVMHYTGMAAYRLDGSLAYDTVLFAASFGVAMLLSVLGLRIKSRLQAELPHWSDPAIVLGSIVLGGAVVGMHYTGMAATYFIRDSGAVLSASMSPELLALGVFVTASALTAVALAAMYLTQTAGESKRANYRLVAVMMLVWTTVSWLAIGEYTSRMQAAAYESANVAARQILSRIGNNLSYRLQTIDGVSMLLTREPRVIGNLVRHASRNLDRRMPASERQRLWEADTELAMLTSQLRDTARAVGTSAIWLLNDAGDAIAASNAGEPGSIVGDNFARQAYFQDSRKGRPGHQYGVGDLDNQVELDHSYPVFRDGYFIGALVARYTLADFRPSLRKSNVLIVDDSGVVMLSDDPRQEFRVMRNSAIERLTEAQSLHRYRRKSLETIETTPWGPRLPELLREAGAALPYVMAQAPVQGHAISLHVHHPVPDIELLATQKVGLFVILSLAGNMLILAVGATALHLQSMRHETVEVQRSHEEVEAALRESREAHRLLAEREASLQAILDSTGVAIFLMDRDGRITLANHATYELFGHSPEQLPKLSYFDLVPVDERDSARRTFTRLMTGEIDIITTERRYLRNDQSVFWGSVTARPLRDNEVGLFGVVGVVSDITHRRDSESAMRLANSVLEAISSAVVVTDPQERIVAVNPAFTQITGFDEDSVLGMTPRVIASGQQSKDFYRELWRTLEARDHWAGEIVNRRRDGEFFPAMQSINVVRDSANRVINYVGVFTDITERRKSEERIRYLAHHDQLTGLSNRARLLERAEDALRMATRHQRRLAILFIDLDRFKPINDTHGHEAGDLVLKTVAERLRAAVRASDTVCRQGGDEFVVLLPEISNLDGLYVLAEKIRTAVGRPCYFEGIELTVTASIGIAAYPENGATVDALIQQADEAMYIAKHERQGRVWMAQRVDVDVPGGS